MIPKTGKGSSKMSSEITKKDIAKACAERVLNHIESIKVINTPINPDSTLALPLSLFDPDFSLDPDITPQPSGKSS